MTKLQQEIETLDSIQGNIFDERMWDDIHQRRLVFLNKKGLTMQSADYALRRLYDVPKIWNILRTIEEGL